MTKCFEYKGSEYTLEELLNHPDFKASIIASQSEIVTNVESTTTQASVSNAPEVVVTETPEDIPVSKNTITIDYEDVSSDALDIDFSLIDGDPNDYTVAEGITSQEIAWTRKALPGVPIRFVDRALVAGNSRYAEGMYHQGAITLWSGGSKGVAYHEAYHAFEDLFLSEDEISTLDKEIGNEEMRAEAFRAYMNGYDGFSKHGLLGELFFTIKNWIQRLLHPFSGKQYTIFERIRKSDYVTTRHSSGDASFSTQSKLMDVERVDVIKSLFAIVYDGGFNLKKLSDRDSLEIEKAYHHMEGKINAIIAATKDSYPKWAQVWSTVLEEKKAIFKDVMKSIEELGIKDVKISEEDATDESSEALADPSDDRIYGKNNYEYSLNKNASKDIKLMASFIRDKTSPRSPYTGTIPFYSQATIMSSLRQLLADVIGDDTKSTMERMKEILKDNLSAKPWLSQFLDKIEKSETFARQFESEFSKQEITFVNSRYGRRVVVDNGNKSYVKTYADQDPAMSKPANKMADDAFDILVTDGIYLEDGDEENQYIVKTNPIRDLDFSMLQTGPIASWNGVKGAFMAYEITDYVLANKIKLNASANTEIKNIASNDYTKYNADKLVKELKGSLSDQEFKDFMSTTLAKYKAESKEQITNVLDTVFNERLGVLNYNQVVAVANMAMNNPKFAEKIYNGLATLNRYMEPGVVMSLDTIEGGKNFFRYPGCRDMFSAIAKVLDFSAETTIQGASGQKFTMAQNNYLSKIMNQWSNDIKGTKSRLKSIRFSQNSEWVNKLENLSVAVHNVTENNGRKADFTDLSEADEFIERISMTLGGNANSFGLTLSDKSTTLVFKGIEPSFFDDTIATIVTTSSGTKRLVFSPLVVDYFFGVINDEFNRIAQSEGSKLNLDHYKKNASQFILFPSLNASTEELKSILAKPEDQRTSAEKLKAMIWDSTTGNLLTNSLQIPAIKAELDNFIQDKLNARVKQVGKTFNELGITMEKLPTESFKHDAYDKTNANQVIAAYVLKSMWGNIEFMRTFIGDPAMYKNLVDVLKRAPEVIAPGQDMTILKPEDRYFKIQVVNDIESKDGTRSEIAKEIYNQYYNVFHTMYKGNQELIDAAMAGYEEVNEADGQAFISPLRWRQIMNNAGKLTEDMDKTFWKIMRGEEVSYKDILPGHSIKGMHFQHRTLLHNGHNISIPTYLKYSQAVIWPSMAKGNPILSKIYDRMVKQEGDTFVSGEFDEMVFKSGIKVGSQDVMSIMDIVDGKEVSTITLDNTYYKIQQDNPAKYMKKEEANKGTQVEKLILSDLELSFTFANGLTGQQIADKMGEIDAELSNLGKYQLYRDWGLKEEDLTTVFNLKKLNRFTKSIVNKMISDEVPIKTINSFAAEMNKISSLEDLNGLLDRFPTYQDKILSTIFSNITKSTVKNEMRGGAFIQVAGVGVQAMTKDMVKNPTMGDIIYLTDNPLKGPRLDKDGNILSAQVFVPQAYLGKDFFEKYPEVYNAGVIDKTKLKKVLHKLGLLEGLVGYRIPTQGMASIDSLEIAGILPQTYGDTVFVYTNNPGKTGADFDIDKMFIMMPDYVKDNDTLSHLAELGISLDKYQRVPSNDAFISKLREARMTLNKSKGDYIVSPEDSHDVKQAKKEAKSKIVRQQRAVEDVLEKALKNNKLDIYTTILTEKSSFGRLIKSLDTPELKQDAFVKRTLANPTVPQDIKDKILAEKSLAKRASIVEQYEKSKKLADLEFVSPEFQIKARQSYSGGKAGVGIVANHITSHSVCQRTKLGMKGKLTKYQHNMEKGVSLHAKYDYFNRFISDNISAYLNANVDVAKDPYIFDAGMNNITLAPAMYLIRSGCPIEYTNAIMCHPVVKMFMDLKRSKISIFGGFKGDEFNKVLEKHGIKDYDDSTDAKKSRASRFSKLTIDDLEKQIANPDLITKDDVVMMLEASTTLLAYSKTLNKLTTSTKHDVDGMGKNYATQIATRLKYEAITQSGEIYNIENLYTTALTAYKNNSWDLFKTALSNLSVATSEAAYNKVYTYVDSLKNGDLNESDVKGLAKIMKGRLAFSRMPDIDRTMLTDKDYLNRVLQTLKEADPNNLFMVKTGIKVYTETIDGKSVSTIGVLLGSVDPTLVNDIQKSYERLVSKIQNDGTDIQKQALADFEAVSILNSGNGKNLLSYNHLIDMVPFQLKSSTIASQEFLYKLENDLLLTDAIIDDWVASGESSIAPYVESVKAGTTPYINVANVFYKRVGSKYVRLAPRVVDGRRIKIYDYSIDSIGSREQLADYDVTVVGDISQVTLSDGTVFDLKGTPLKLVISEQVNISNDLKSKTIISGGATGADTVWVDTAKKLGVLAVIEHTVNNYDALSDSDKSIINDQYQAVRKFLGRPNIDGNIYKGKLVRRDMMQSNDGDAIYAIATLIPAGDKNKEGFTNKNQYAVPDGGTGYAVARGILSNKPTYVFNQGGVLPIGWYKWKSNSLFESDITNGDFIRVDVPTLSSKFVGVGTRAINDKGVEAIKNILSGVTTKVQEVDTSSFGVDSFETTEDFITFVNNLDPFKREALKSIVSAQNNC